MSIDLVTQITNLLLNQGTSGLALIALAYCVYHLQKTNEKLQVERLDDMRQLTAILKDNAVVLAQVTDIMKGCRSK